MEGWSEIPWQGMNTDITIGAKDGFETISVVPVEDGSMVYHLWQLSFGACETGSY